MALRLGSDPELAEIVELARRRAQEADELSPASARPLTPVLDPEVREVVARWIGDGGYQRAVAAVVVHDPELADQ